MRRADARFICQHNKLCSARVLKRGLDATGHRWAGTRPAQHLEVLQAVIREAPANGRVSVECTLGALKVGCCGPVRAGGGAGEGSKEVGGQSLVSGRENAGYRGELLVNRRARGELRLQLRSCERSLAAACGRRDFALKDFDGNVAGGYRLR